MVALLKYPLSIGPMDAFPEIGVEYDLNLIYTDASGNDLKGGLTVKEQQQLNLSWLEAGLGTDITLNTEAHTEVKWYLRVEVLLAYNPFSGHFGLETNLLYGCTLPPTP